MRKLCHILTVAMASLVLTASAVALPCEGLTSLHIPQMKVTLAEKVEAGQFKPPPAGQAGTFDKLPSFCRVEATLQPTRDSEIKIEVWLPEELTWNGKYEAVG